MVARCIPERKKAVWFVGLGIDRAAILLRVVEGNTEDSDMLGGSDVIIIFSVSRLYTTVLIPPRFASLRGATFF